MAKTKKQKEAERLARINKVADLRAQNEVALVRRVTREIRDLDAQVGLCLYMAGAMQIILARAEKLLPRVGTQYGHEIVHEQKAAFNTIQPAITKVKTVLNVFFERYMEMQDRNLQLVADKAIATDQYLSITHEMAELAAMFLNAKLSNPDVMDVLRPVLNHNTMIDDLMLSIKAVNGLKQQR